VGIEVQSELVEQSNDNALETGVADRVRFVEGDFFELGRGQATLPSAEAEAIERVIRRGPFS
jgi:hypothetical protein